MSWAERMSRRRQRHQVRPQAKADERQRRQAAGGQDKKGGDQKAGDKKGADKKGRGHPQPSRDNPSPLP